MESDEHYSSTIYSCAMCENLSDLRASCCCQENKLSMVEVTETRLLKRGNLQKGDYLCSSHYEKLKSGMIFGGGGSGCCAPFHVGQSRASRLRPVPRKWRQMFDNSAISNRYLPSLQICGQCYSITLDLMLNTEKNNDETWNDSAFGSAKSSYTSPRRWMSTMSLHVPSSSTSGSSWPISSSRNMARSSSNLMSLYASQRGKLNRPAAVPESVKRYFKYKNQNKASQENETPSTTRNTSTSSEPSSINTTDSHDDVASVFEHKTQDEERASTSSHVHDCLFTIDFAIDKGINDADIKDRHNIVSNHSNDSSQRQDSSIRIFECVNEEERELELKNQRRILEKSVELTLAPNNEATNSLNQIPRKAHVIKSSLVYDHTEGNVLSQPKSPHRKTSDSGLSLESANSPASSTNTTCHKDSRNEKNDFSNKEKDYSKKNKDEKPIEKYVSYERKPIQVTIQSIASLSQVSQEDACLGEDANKPSKSYCSQEIAPKPPSNIQFIEIAKKNAVSQHQTSEFGNSNEISSMTSVVDKSTLLVDENNHSPSDVDVMSLNSRQRGALDVINSVLSCALSFGQPSNDVKELIKVVEKLNSSVLQVFARALARSIISFAQEDAANLLNRRQKSYENFPATVLGEAEKLLSQFKVQGCCESSLCRARQEVYQFANIKTQEIMADALPQVQKEMKKLKDSPSDPKLVQAIDNKVHEALFNDKRLKECPTSCSQICTNTSVKWLEKKQCYRTVFNIQLQERDGNDNFMRVPRSPNVSTQSEDAAEFQYKEMPPLSSNSLQVVECIVEDLIPISRSFSTGFIDKCVEDEEANTLARSTSTGSFFTMTCQLTSNEQVSSPNNFTPVGTVNNLHKELESGVFVSATNTDRSCTGSMAGFTATDYSDYDQDSLWSQYTQMSSVDESSKWYPNGDGNISQSNEWNESKNFEHTSQSLDVCKEIPLENLPVNEFGTRERNLTISNEGVDKLAPLHWNETPNTSSKDETFSDDRNVGSLSTTLIHNLDSPGLTTMEKDDNSIGLPLSSAESEQRQTDFIQSNPIKKRPYVSELSQDSNNVEENTRLPAQDEDKMSLSNGIDHDLKMLRPSLSKQCEKLNESLPESDNFKMQQQSLDEEEPSNNADNAECKPKEKILSSPNADAKLENDQQQEQIIHESTPLRSSPAKNQARRNTADWFPTEDLLKQRRSNQFMKALSQAALLNTRAQATHRSIPKKSDEEAEDEDASDIIAGAIEECTPVIFRRKAKQNVDDDTTDRSKVLMRTVAFLGIVGVLVFAGWRYYYNPPGPEQL